MTERIFNEYQRKVLYENAVTAYGTITQLDQVTEECAELIVAINQMKRGRVGAIDVLKEVADVMIMCEQLTYMITDNRLEPVREYNEKLLRLKKNVDEKLLELEKGV